MERHEEGVEVIGLELSYRRRRTLSSEERIELVDGRAVRGARGRRSTVGGKVAHEGPLQVADIAIVGVDSRS